MKIQPEKPLAIGIDLGTTNSLVAVQLNDEVVVIPNSAGSLLLPSAVSQNNLNEIVVGEEALKNKEVILSSKRLLGKSAADVLKTPALQAFTGGIKEDNIVLTSNKFQAKPYEIASLILKTLKKQAEDFLKRTINLAVITVPAYFDDTARQLTKHAGECAGLTILRLLNEPTAAALAYGIDETYEGNYIVYDLGGGTFDISILQIYKGISKVVATNGNTLLGGDDFDKEIVQYIWPQLRIENYSVEYLKLLLPYAKLIKELLSTQKIVNHSIQIADKIYEVIISQDQFNALITPYIIKTLKLVEETIKASGISKHLFKKIILAGGATKIPLIRAKLAEFFKEAELLTKLNPETVVAIGAAIQANNLVNPKSSILIDVLPLSLGIETMGGLFEKIIVRNSPLPTQKTQLFTTYLDNQTSIKIHIAQGEDNLIQNNHTLGIFNLLNIPRLPAGQPKIQVTFTVNENGILTVSAHEISTEQRREIVITSSLPEQEIQNHLLLKEIKDSLTLLLVTLSDIINSPQFIDSEQYYNLLTELNTAIQDSIDIIYLTNLKTKVELIITQLQKHKHLA